METLSKWFWNEWIWLPENYTWEDVRPNSETQFTDFGHLVYPIFIGILMIPLRWFTERYMLQDIGIRLGLSREVSVASSSHPRPVKLKKFTESGWKFLCYASLWTFGLIILLNKSWLWDSRHCWIGYPKHNVDGDIWWYYILSTSFYWSLFLSQFSDVKRKDFWQMCLHHILTIGLLCFSWVCNLTRIGSLIILIHDTSDVLLEIGKMAKYAGWHRLCDMVFAVFAISWIVTRLGIYPLYILRSTLFESISLEKIFPVYYIFNTMLLSLLVLHIFWTYFILKVAIRALSNEDYEDSRSSDEDDEKED